MDVPVTTVVLTAPVVMAQMETVVLTAPVVMAQMAILLGLVVRAHSRMCARSLGG